MSDEREPRPFQTLLREAQQGSQAAAEELYETYVKYVLKCVRRRMYHKLRTRFDSQDFVQQAWASFFVGNLKIPDFQSPNEMIAYLQTIAERKVVMEGRRVRGGKCNASLEELIDTGDDPIGPHPATRLPTPSTVAVFREEYKSMIGEEDDRTREVAQMRYEGSSFDEIGEEMAIDESKARLVMRRLKRKLAPPPEEPRSE